MIPAEPGPSCGAAAQTRMVSVARIRLDPRKSVRPFKGIICDDISEFEFYMPSQPVRSPPLCTGGPPTVTNLVFHLGLFESLLATPQPKEWTSPVI
jgi:hypothetical protein